MIAAACAALANDDSDAAASLLRNEYPFAPELVTKRKFRPLEYTRIFIRDGFVDRYTSQRLVFPPVLRLVSHSLPKAFPYHPNWKTHVTHPAYWEVGATIDHLIPVTRGGPDDPSNWYTTSMARNSAKMNCTLAELGWELKPPGDLRDWDGLLSWCIQYSVRHPEAVTDSGLRAGSTALAELGESPNNSPG